MFYGGSDGATLLQLIKDWILHGTYIISDGWRAYNDIAILDVIIHEDNFIDPNNLDTKTLEARVVRLKECFGRCMAPPEDSLDTYLVEVM